MLEEAKKQRDTAFAKRIITELKNVVSEIYANLE